MDFFGVALYVGDGEDQARVERGLDVQRQHPQRRPAIGGPQLRVEIAPDARLADVVFALDFNPAAHALVDHVAVGEADVGFEGRDPAPDELVAQQSSDG